jgi:hypothetical protein
MSDERVLAELAAMRGELEALKAQRATGRRWRLALLGGLLAAGAALAQPVITSFTADAPAQAAQVNANFTNLRDWTVPRGAIILWEGATCPAGYAELLQARGRFVVGTPSGANGNTTFGPALTNGENRETLHAHGGTTSAFAGYQQGEVNYSVQPGFASPWMIRQFLAVDPTAVRTNDVAPHLYLRYCKKS